METDTIMHNARELKLTADRYAFFQDALARGPEDVQWMANEVSSLRIAMIRMSQCLQGVALDRTRDALKQLELDYATDVGMSLEHSDHAKAIEDLCKTRE